MILDRQSSIRKIQRTVGEKTVVLPGVIRERRLGSARGTEACGSVLGSCGARRAGDLEGMACRKVGLTLKIQIRNTETYLFGRDM